MPLNPPTWAIRLWPKAIRCSTAASMPGRWSNSDTGKTGVGEGWADDDGAEVELAEQGWALIVNEEIGDEDAVNASAL